MIAAEVAPVSSPVLTGGFSYAILDAAAAAIAREAAEVIRGVHTAYILEVGQHLLRAKEVLPHGSFEAWVRDAVGMQPRTARNIMTTAQWLDGKPAAVADLPSGVLYALASPTTPAGIMQDVVADASAGAPLDADGIKARLDAAADERRELKAAQRRSPKLTGKQLAAKARQQREDRVRPLALAITTLGEGRVAELVDVLLRWGEAQALADVLRAGIRQVSSGAGVRA